MKGVGLRGGNPSRRGGDRWFMTPTFLDKHSMDPARIIETATFEVEPSFSADIDHIVVNGVAVVREGKTAPDQRLRHSN